MIPNQSHIDHLLANPNLADEFDQKFGQGSAIKILNEVNTKNQEEDGFISNTIQGLKTGLKEGGRETLETLEKAGDYLQEKIPLPGVALGSDADNGIIDILSPEELEQRELQGEAQPFQNIANLIPESEPSDSIVESIVGGVTQFAVGWVTGGRLLTPAKTVTKTGAVLKSLGKGATADFQVFDENQARFSDFLIDTFPELEDTFLEYLAADPEDTFVEGKFKNVIEGLGLGVATELVFKLARGSKEYFFARKNGDNAEAEKVIKNRTDEISEELDNTYERKVELKEVNTTGNVRIKATDAEIKKLEEFDESEAGKQIQERIKLYRKGKITINEIADVPLNFSKIKIKNKEDFIKLTKNVYDNIKQFRDEADEVKTLDEVWDGVDELLLEPDEVLFKSQALNDSLDNADELLTALRVVNLSLEAQLKSDSAARTVGKITQEQYKQSWNNFLTSLSIRKGISKKAARVQNTGRLIINGDSKALDDLAEEFSFRKDEPEVLDYIAKKVAAIKDKDNFSFRKFVNDYLLLGKFRSLDKINNIWINGLLSNPKTHAINMTSNLMMALIRPVEQIVGGLASGNLREARDGISVAAGLIKYQMDSLRAAHVAWKNADAVLDKVSKNKNELYIEPPKTAVDKVIQSPTRALQAEDEFFKQINYRAKVYSKVVREALDKKLSTKKTVDIGRGKKASEFDLYVEKRFNEGFAKDGSALYKDALDYAQENTFTKQLRQGTIGASVQTAVNNSPLLRQIMPFVRTPVNIAIAFGQRVPGVSLLSKRFRKEFFSPDPRIKAAARGKQAIGAAMFTTAWYLYQAGAITGSVDNNRVKNRQKFDTGWRPYSFKFGDTYYSYERLDPIGMFFGLFADMADVWDRVSEDERQVLGEANFMALVNQMDVKDGIDLVTGTAFATAKNLVSKTYVKSLADTLELLNSGNPDRGGAFIRSKLGSFVPSIIPAIINDPYYREAREYTDTLKNRIGIEGDMSFNAMGEPRLRSQSAADSLISPMTTTVEVDDIVSKEFVRLNQAFGGIGSDIGLGLNIDLTKFQNKQGKNAFVQYNEILQSLEVRKALEDLIKSDRYKKLSDNYVGDDMAYKGSKTAVIQKLLTTYKKRALKKLLKNESFVSKDGLSFRDSYINNKKNNIRQKRSKELLPLY